MSRDGLERSMQRGAVIEIAGLGPGSPMQRMRVGPSPHQLNHFSRSSTLPGCVGTVLASGSWETTLRVRRPSRAGQRTPGWQRYGQAMCHWVVRQRPAWRSVRNQRLSPGRLPRDWRPSGRRVKALDGSPPSS
jgi:hypothetical protein